MKCQVALVFLSLLVYKLLTTEAKPPSSRQLPLSSLPYSTIQFVQSWGPGYCKDPSSKCRSDRQAMFYIHGLWPADSTGDSLQNCKGFLDNLKPGYLGTLINNMKTKLETNWKSLNMYSTDLKFWAGEWSRHGVCSVKTIPNPETYFRKGLAAKDKANLEANLEKANILPGGGTYSKDDIQTALRNDLGSDITIYITCYDDGTRVYLKELYLCMDVYAVKFIPCPAKSDSASCRFPPQRNILIPGS